MVAFLFLFSSLLPVSLASEDSFSQDGLGTYTPIIPIEEFEGTETEEEFEDELLQADHPLSPPTDEIQVLHAEVAAVKIEIQGLYAMLSQAIVEAASMAEIVQVNIFKEIALFESSRDSLVLSNAPINLTDDTEDIPLSVSEGVTEGVVQENFQRGALSGTSWSGNSEPFLFVESGFVAAKEETSKPILGDLVSEKVKSLNVEATSGGMVEMLMNFENLERRKKIRIREDKFTAEELKIELEELEDDRDDLKELVKKVTHIIYTSLQEIRAKVKEKSDVESRIRTRRIHSGYEEALKNIEAASLTSTAIFHQEEQNYFSVAGEDGDDEPESVIDAVEMDMTLAAIHTFLNPPKGTSPAHRLFLYMSQVDIEKQRQYMRTLSKIRKMNRLAEERDNLVIRVMGKEFPHGFPALLLMGRNVLFELVEKNMKS